MWIIKWSSWVVQSYSVGKKIPLLSHRVAPQRHCGLPATGVELAALNGPHQYCRREQSVCTNLLSSSHHRQFDTRQHAASSSSSLSYGINLL